MAPTLIGAKFNARVRRVLAVAALAGVELNHDESFKWDSNWKTPEFLQKFPLGKLPVLEDGEFRLYECAAIAEYVALLAPNQTLIPSDPKEVALVRQWNSVAESEIFLTHASAHYMIAGYIPYNKPVFSAAYEKLLKTLDALEKVFVHQTYAVGERITLADVMLATSLCNAFTGLVDASARAKLPNLVRYTETFMHHPKLESLFANEKFVETQPAYQPPAKEKAPKAPKEPKPETAKAPKEPKEKAKPKAKEPEDEEEEPLVPEEPKAKNPLDDLPKSAFNLEEWKRQYSNLDTRGANGSLEWFYEKFDHEGFSIWRVDFKYNDELTQVFMSSNQVGGFFNRLEASRKYLFGSVGVLGKANDSVISGVLICRGQDIKPVVEVAPDWESYEFKSLDVKKDDDKAFFEGAMAWDLIVDGKEWADGKNFK